MTFSTRTIVTPTAQGFSGTLDGSIAIYDSLSILNTAGRVLASCRSATHAFTLVRQQAAEKRGLNFELRTSNFELDEKQPYSAVRSSQFEVLSSGCWLFQQPARAASVRRHLVRLSLRWCFDLV
jgi:hypothetical protein